MRGYLAAIFGSINLRTFEFSEYMSSNTNNESFFSFFISQLF
jgi:hypothetical protein